MSRQQPPHTIYVREKGISSGAAAILSLLLPGVGQICQGRWIVGLFAMSLTILGYVFCFIPGIVMHLVTVVDAARN